MARTSSATAALKEGGGVRSGYRNGGRNPPRHVPVRHREHARRVPHTGNDPLGRKRRPVGRVRRLKRRIQHPLAPKPNNLRANMPTVTLAFRRAVHDDHWINRVVARLTGGAFCHVEIALPGTENLPPPNTTSRKVSDNLPPNPSHRPGTTEQRKTDPNVYFQKNRPPGWHEHPRNHSRVDR